MLEAEFAIGKPATSAKHVTCSRCKGTGWWQLGRKCFKCGGFGRAEHITDATRLRDKRAHVAEATKTLAATEAYVPRWGKAGHAALILRERAHLTKLQAELAALEAKLAAK